MDPPQTRWVDVGDSREELNAASLASGLHSNGHTLSGDGFRRSASVESEPLAYSAVQDGVEHVCLSASRELDLHVVPSVKRYCTYPQVKVLPKYSRAKIC